MQDSIRDGATLPLHFEPRLSEIHIDEAAINAAFEELAEANDLDRGRQDKLSRKAASIEALIKAPERIRQIAADIAEHFTTKVEPEGFKAQVVVYDKASCVAYKNELDKMLDAEASTVVMCKSRNDPLRVGAVDTRRATSSSRPRPVQRPCRSAEDHHRHRQAADRLRCPDPVRAVPGQAAEGAHAAASDHPHQPGLPAQQDPRPDRRLPRRLRRCRQGVQVRRSESVTADHHEHRGAQGQLEPAIEAALAFFPGVDRTVGGYEGLIQAQTAIADDAKKDAFGLAYSVVSQLWETISPDPMLSKFEKDYRWLTDVYESVRPSDITGRLVWHALGAKTIDLINEHVLVELPDARHRRPSCSTPRPSRTS